VARRRTSDYLSGALPYLALETFKGTYEQPNFSYLHERDHKRELRLQSAKEGTRISASEHEDLKRNLEFTLRAAFVQTLEAKAVLELGSRSRVLRPHHRDQPRPLQGRRPCADRPRSNRAAAGAIRIRDSTAIVNLRTAEDPAPATIERSRAVGAVRCDGSLRFLRDACSRWTISDRCLERAARSAGGAADDSAVGDQS